MMESSPNDDLLQIASFLRKLSEKLTESRAETEQLRTISKELLNDTTVEYQTVIQDPEIIEKQKNLCDIPDDELSEAELISKLENERLALIMSLQREEFLSSKYIKVLQENEELVKSISEYMVNKDKNRFFEKQKNDMLMNNRLMTISEKINLIDSRTVLFKERVKQIEQMLKYTLDKIEENNDILISESFQESISDLIAIINKTMQIEPLAH